MTKFEMLDAQITAKRVELEALLKQFRDKMKSEFAQLTKFFFEETDLQAVIWNQYTPSFNDGEPCTFTLGEAIFIREGFDPEDLMSADNYEDDEIYGTVPIGWYGRENTDPLTSVCDKFNAFLQANSNLLESMFEDDDGYGCTVYLTKDQTYTASYDCGY